MRWRRILSHSFMALLFVLLMPVIAFVVVVMLALLVVVGAAYGLSGSAVRLWNSLPRHRRAIERARADLDGRLPGRNAAWHVVGRDRHRCIVRATLPLMTSPRTVWLYAVWDDGRLDDLGTWQFHDGIEARHAAAAYDRAAAAGTPWPRDMGALVRSMRPAAPAEPERRPHFGSVLVRRAEGFSFFAHSAMVAAVFAAGDLAGAEFCDAECRPLAMHEQGAHLGFTAAFPPAPPDKVFIVRLRHYLMERAEGATKGQVGGMLPAELADHGIRSHDDSGLIDAGME